MSNQIKIESLPNEMLTCILRQLDWYDLQSSMLVCQRWASAAASLAIDSGSTSVLKIYMSEKTYELRQQITSSWTTYNYEEVIEALFFSQRLHKNLFLIWGNNDTPSQRILSILKRLGQCVDSLIVRPISSPFGYILDRDLSKILKIFPNLKHLDIEEIFIHARSNTAFKDVPGYIDLAPMNTLRSLHTGGIFELPEETGSPLEVFQELSDVFVNLTSLHAVVHSDDYYLKDLYRKLSSRLIHLRLYSSTHPFAMFPNEDFPILETFEVIENSYERSDTSNEHLGRFVRRVPKLKSLNLEPRVDSTSLEMLCPLQKTLKNLAIFVEPMNLDILQSMEQLGCLEQFELMIFRSSFPSRSVPALRSIRKLKLEIPVEEFSLDEIWSSNWFPNLTVLELQIEDPFNTYLSVVNQVPSLNRLVFVESEINPRSLKLKPFLEFCSQLKVPELELYSYDLEKGDWNSSTPESKAFNLRKLIIHAYQIESDCYVPMLGSMPALRKLKLNLEKPCESHIFKTLLIQFPMCDVVRSNKSNYRRP